MCTLFLAPSVYSFNKSFLPSGPYFSHIVNESMKALSFCEILGNSDLGLWLLEFVENISDVKEQKFLLELLVLQLQLSQLGKQVIFSLIWFLGRNDSSIIKRFPSYLGVSKLCLLFCCLISQ